MKFSVSFSILVTIAILASSVLGKFIDWTSHAAHQCALQNWDRIKSIVDIRLADEWEHLSPFIKAGIIDTGALNTNITLINNPTAEQISVLARGLPRRIFHPFADAIVSKCMGITLQFGTNSGSAQISATYGSIAWSIVVFSSLASFY
ncbi:hypothetical protein IWW36_001403 [Coemansia brasiliensis]|uniref:Uncharacterized protein n=1 Tax=Coemansia brasiliensis TaxID=2650707 RepID=A0A9W8IBQ5_9FUNG|nr:hypothetical protein IWW36_001403 [Coemansia brasiliensis]